jgi:tetratricopeptide (TPR) repeat protein
VGALAGRRAEEALRELTAAHLVDEQTAGRYRMHDLLRIYATDHASDQRIAANQRLLDWYLARTRVAGTQLNIPRLLIPPDEGPEPAPVEEFSSGDAAMAWLEAERANLVAAVLDAAGHDPRPAGWRLAMELRGFFRLRRYVADWVAVATAGLQLAERLADTRAQAALQHSLGHASWSVGEYAEAIDRYKRTLALSAEAGWLSGEAGAASALGSVYHEMGQHDEAIASYEGALRTGALSPELEIITGGSLGLVYQSVGRLREAVDVFRRTADLAERRGLTDMLATSLGNLGLSHLDLGDLGAAREYLGRALTLYRQVGSRNGEANVLSGLALLDAETGHHDEATYQAVLALRIARDIGDRRIECDALSTAGAVARRRGDLAGAHERLVEAIDLAESVGYGRGLTPSLAELAVVDLGLGDLAAAAAHAARALALARSAHHKPAEAQTLVASVRVSLARGEYHAAVQQARTAVEISRELGLRLTLARSLYTLDEALRATGDPAPSPYLTEATAILAELGCVE